MNEEDSDRAFELYEKLSARQREVTDSMAKILPFTGVTRLDLPPDQILDGAKGKLTGLIVMGYTEDDEMYFASSYADKGTVLWLLEQCKKQLLG